VALFGHVTQGALQSSAVAGDTKIALKTVAPENGTVTEIYADLQNNGSEIQAFRMGIYNDAPSVSGATLVDQTDITLLSPGATRTWVRFSGISASILFANVYWITLQAGPTGGNATYWYDSGVGNSLIAGDTFADGLATTFGTPTSQPTNSIALYASYVSAYGAVVGIKAVARGSVGWK
jgi:hypothetical protein